MFRRRRRPPSTPPLLHTVYIPRGTSPDGGGPCCACDPQVPRRIPPAGPEAQLDSGTNASVKERKAGRVPEIVFEQEDGLHGGKKRLISVRANQVRKLVKHLGRSFFLPRLFEMEVREGGFDDDGTVVGRVRALPRKLHLHLLTDAPLNVTFLRAPSRALLKVEDPLICGGEDVSPGLSKGSSLITVKRTAKFLCPADIVLPYVDVDLSDVKVYPVLKLLQSKDEPVCKIMGARVSDHRRK